MVGKLDSIVPIVPQVGLERLPGMAGHEAAVKSTQYKSLRRYRRVKDYGRYEDFVRSVVRCIASFQIFC